MTMGNLRVSLLLAYLATTAAILWAGSAGGRMDQMIAAVIVSCGLLGIPTLLVGRIQQDVPVSGLGIASVSVLVFVLGMTAPALLMVQPWLGGAAFVLLLVVFVVFWRRATAALAAHHDVLRPSAGDGDVGAFTGLTPISPAPTVVPEPTAPEASHSVYDPTAARDPMAGLSRPSRAAGRRGSGAESDRG